MIGHGEIGNHQIRMPVLKRVHGALAVGGHAHIVSAGGEAGAQHARNLGFVINDQNAVSVSHGSMGLFVVSDGQLAACIVRFPHRHGRTKFLRGDKSPYFLYSPKTIRHL